MTLKQLHEAAAEACKAVAENKGEDVLLLDLHELPAAADYFILVTSRSRAHSRGLAETLEESLEHFSLPRRGIEGYPDSPWILLDYNGIVAHVFQREERDYYGMERLWSSANVERFQEGKVEQTRI